MTVLVTTVGHQLVSDIFMWHGIHSISNFFSLEYTDIKGISLARRARLL